MSLVTFSSISSPKIPHFITVASGSKVASQGIGKISLSPSLNLNSVLYNPHCPYNLISLSQLTRSFNEIKNQFGKTIKILRSDNANEYFSTAFSSFLSSHGILHQSTCPHTPQQNGIVERKNKHLIETARSLMLNTNVPVHHWGDAVLTACFLINRMPSSSIENKVPHSIIFPNDPLYRVSPRVFGCTCFVHNVSPGLDKLSAKAIKCVFLGYSCL